MVDDPKPWPDLDLSIPEHQATHIRPGNVELLRRLAEDTLRGQVEGGRLLIARSYIVLGQAATLAGAAAGGVGLSSGASAIANGWAGHLSVTIGFGLAFVVWSTSAGTAFAAIFPREFSAVAVHPRDLYTVPYLSDEPRELDLVLIRHFDAAIESNRTPIAKLRNRLRWSQGLLATAPIIGLAGAVAVRVARLLLL